MQILPLYKYHSKKGIGWIMILKEEPILRTVYTNTKTPKFIVLYCIYLFATRLQ